MKKYSSSMLPAELGTAPAYPLINTQLQLGGCAVESRFNRFNGFPKSEAASRPSALVRCRLALLGSLAALLLSGCQNLTYTAPGGERFSRTSLGARSSIAALVVETSTNGVRRVELRGYRTDASKEWEAITAAAVRAAIQEAK